MSDPQRFELRWPGKYDARGQRAAVPRPGLRPVALEVHPSADPTASADGPDRLLFGDNLLVLDALVRAQPGSVDLVYIDPPFGTGGRFSVATRVGVGEGGSSVPEFVTPAYHDRFEGGAGGFVAMLDARLRLIWELLAPHGSLYIHVDPTVGHAVKLLADDVFGPQSFQREIVWRIGWVSGFKTKARNWIRNHDLIFFYTKDPKRFTFNKVLVPYPEGYRRRDGSPPRGEGMPVEDVWNANETDLGLRGAESLDSIQIKSFSGEKSGYATQKNESLLRRIIAASSNPGDLVADFFCGSGTTVVAATSLGRRFIACDVGPAAVHITKKRLLALPRSRALLVESFATAQWERWWGESGNTVGAAQRERDGRGVHVVGSNVPVTSEVLREVAKDAGRRGLVAVDVVAPIWDLPLDSPGPESSVLTRLRLGPELPSTDPWFEVGRATELPRIDLRLHGLPTGEVTLELAGYRFDHPDRLPLALQQAVRADLDYVDAWWVAWDAPDDPPLLELGSFRTHRHRVLQTKLGPHRYVGPGPFRLRVRLVDVLHQSTEVAIELQRHERGLAIVQGRLRTVL